MRDLPNLDFVRACAVLAVVLEHVLLAYKIQWLGPWEVRWMGVVGVFIFFVHTSLVLMWSLERKPHTFDFYIRRAFRLYPLIWLAILVTVAFHVPVSGATTKFFHYSPPDDRRQILTTAALLSNLSSKPYLPLGVMWSLPYEAQMYLFLPFFFFFVRRNFSLWPLLLLWLFLVRVNSVTFPDTPHNFFLCLPYFIPGIIAYVGFGRYKAILPSWSFPLALLLLWAIFMRRPDWRPANYLCLALGLCLPLFHQITAGPLIRISHTVAKYSYGIYLSHPFAIVLGIYVLPHSSLAVQLSVVLLGTAVFSVGAYHLLEYPMIRLGARLANRAESLYEQRTLNQYRIPEADIS